jgi:hypothetical protein
VDGVGVAVAIGDDPCVEDGEVEAVGVAVLVCDGEAPVERLGVGDELGVPDRVADPVADGDTDGDTDGVADGDASTTVTLVLL